MKEKNKAEEFDEDHALDMAMNDMVKDFTLEDIETIVEANENPPVPNQKLKEAAEAYKKIKK